MSNYFNNVCGYNNIFIKGLFSINIDNIERIGGCKLKQSAEQNIYEVTVDNVTGTPEQKADKLWRRFLQDNNFESSEMVAMQCKDYKNDELVVKAFEYATDEQLALWQPLIDKAYKSMLSSLVNKNKKSIEGVLGRNTLERLREMSHRIEVDTFYAQRKEALEFVKAESDALCDEFSKYSLKFCKVFNNVLDKVSLKKGLTKYKADVFYVPYGITEINFGAFSGCKNINKVILPSTVTKINYNAFRDCKSIKTVVMMGVKSIGDWAFWGCENLGYLMFPETLETVGESVFYGCKDLTVFTLNIERGKNWSFSWDVISDELSTPVNTLWSGMWQVKDGIPYKESRDLVE